MGSLDSLVNFCAINFCAIMFYEMTVTSILEMLNFVIIFLMTCGICATKSL